jgi:hypothetical protein
MAYFVFQNDSENLEGTLYRVAENQNDLNNLNIDKNFYKIIEDSQNNFENYKYGTKLVIKYSNNSVVYENTYSLFKNKESLKEYIYDLKESIKNFLKNNTTHIKYNDINNYLNQLESLDLNNITYPLNKSLEQYFKDQNQLSFHPLQIP